MSKSAGRSERVESSWGGGGDGTPAAADLKKTKGQGHEHLLYTACLYGTETLALTELHQQRLQVCENNYR